mmetsp:Transcript_29818/g.62267  ORF Transcript_29818/g.62267 Transcript_29818/m.62267 type:complete len:201 (-) Transcript_29818:1301-1903(-)
MRFCPCCFVLIVRVGVVGVVAFRRFGGSAARRDAPGRPTTDRGGAGIRRLRVAAGNRPGAFFDATPGDRPDRLGNSPHFMIFAIVVIAITVIVIITEISAALTLPRSACSIVVLPIGNTNADGTTTLPPPLLGLVPNIIPPSPLPSLTLRTASAHRRVFATASIAYPGGNRQRHRGGRGVGCGRWRFLFRSLRFAAWSCR